ncbi:DNA helicase II/ATP-dependent DNA helicase PcrA [Bathymodiolus japonicus methanotrophic gill symbiont]|nr:DNA helicase II/ATP-dependent DNA helicase PcrA [Bathymodiolus japonicus methanotrophic gill symbiont]
MLNFKKDLKMDFESYMKHIDTPIFHRLKFEEVSFYLTKSKFHDVLVSSNEHGGYRIFSWDDWRAQPLLGIELGDENPRHGVVDLIGRYTPIENDLIDVQYETDEGKAFFESAKVELEEKKQKPHTRKDLDKKIDSRAFMRMGEIIPTGAQGKAIYGEGNYIIDGAAGTGKSTTVLQKIKILQKHGSVSSKKILVLVKNESVISEFNNLLETISISGLKIKSAEGFVSDIFQHNVRDISAIIDNTWQIASYINESLMVLNKEVDSMSSRIFSNIGNNDLSLQRGFDKYPEITKILNKYHNLRGEFVDLCKRNRNEINRRKNEIKIEIETYKQELKDKRLKKNNKEKRRFSIKRMFQPSEKTTSLTLGEEADIRDMAEEFKKKRNSIIDKVSKKSKEKEDKALENIRFSINKIRTTALSEEFLTIYTSGEEENYLLQLHIKKLVGQPTAFNTIIVDEAQDVTLSNIYLAWLMADNVILTGDELQKEEPDGIGSWQNLGVLEKEFSKDNQLNIFTLSHNFRQTFELGNFSFNFRQLILGKPLTDIGEEYFENQKGFKKPQLALIHQASDFCVLVKNKVKLISQTFSDSMPAVIFYENEASLDRLTSILDKEDIKYGYDGDETHSAMFVNMGDISGRSFPVVMMPLINSTNENSIYIMISRAKYDLCMFTGKDKEINKQVMRLLSEGIVVRYEAANS